MKTVSIDIARTLDTLYVGGTCEVFNAAGGFAAYRDLVPAHEVRELLARVDVTLFAKYSTIDQTEAALADAESEIAGLEERNAQLSARISQLERLVAKTVQDLQALVSDVADPPSVPL